MKSPILCKQNRALLCDLRLTAPSFILSFMLSSVLPVLRNLPTTHPRTPLLPGFKRSPFAVWPLLFLAALVVFVALSAWRIADNEAGTAPRSVAVGRVTQVERIGGNVAGAPGQNFVKYQFMAGDKLTTGNELTGIGADAPELGDEIRISYDAAAPRDNTIAPPASQLRSERLLTRIAFIVVPIFALLWLFFMFSLFTAATPRDWLNWRRARGLYRNGEITTGRVQFVRQSLALRSPNNTTNFEIVATYKVEGVRLLATTRCNNAWLVGQLAPEVEVVIAYDPLKPERAVILEPFAF